MEHAEGLRHLTRHLLDHCSLPAESKALARALLLADGLRPLKAVSLDDLPPPLALWRRETGGALSSVQILLLDLGGAGHAALELPDAALGDSDHYAVLSLPSDFTESELRGSYRKISLRVHPDKPGGKQVRAGP